MVELEGVLPQYKFVELIGRGGMGAVYRATQLSLDRPVAIKVLPGDLLSDSEPNYAARFRQEALTMAQLTHPGIVGVHESGQVGRFLYIVMELVEGSDVARMIQREGRLTSEATASLMEQVCEAIDYAHQRGVIHRDLKPANILVTREGRVKIADFGLAKRDDNALLQLTSTHVTIGTPDFIAPEAWTPGTPLDSRSDVYSLGVTLYQMLTGEVPRGLWEMPSQRFDTDSRLDAIIERAMQPKPEARYQSSVEMRRDLQRLKEQPRPKPRRFVPARVFNQSVAMMVVVAILVLAGLGFLGALKGPAWWRALSTPAHPMLAFSKPPRSLAFGEPGQLVSVRDLGPLLPVRDVTVEFWACLRRYSVHTVFLLEPDWVFNRFFGTLGFSQREGERSVFWDYGSITTEGRLQAQMPEGLLGQWVHYAFVGDRRLNSLLIYTNGVLWVSKKPFWKKEPSFGLLAIGGHAEGGNGFPGRLSEFRIWETGRSAEEIRDNYTRTLSGRENGLLLYLPFDEESGEVATNWAVATGYKYNGLLSGAPKHVLESEAP